MAASAPDFWVLSLNWVIREASPKPVMQFSAQASCACSGTWDWTKKMLLSGSMPAAMYWAATMRVRLASSAGSKSTVMACRSGMKNTASYSACMSTQLRTAPM